VGARVKIAQAPAPDRTAILDAAAIAAGDAWVQWWRQELQRQGRPMCGGWPGTLSEARRRVLDQVIAVLGAAGAPSAVELAELAHAAFAKARAGWMANAVSERE
jgi:hypothetical protein